MQKPEAVNQNNAGKPVLSVRKRREEQTEKVRLEKRIDLETEETYFIKTDILFQAYEDLEAYHNIENWEKYLSCKRWIYNIEGIDMENQLAAVKNTWMDKTKKAEMIQQNMDQVLQKNGMLKEQKKSLYELLYLFLSNLLQVIWQSLYFTWFQSFYC